MFGGKGKNQERGEINMHTKEKQEKFIELRARGYSFDRIVKEIEVSKPTLIKWQSEFEKEIKNFEYFIYQGLIEKYKLDKELRYKNYSEALEKINRELSGRDFTTMSIRDLILLKNDIEKDFNKEIQGIKYHTGEMVDHEPLCV